MPSGQVLQIRLFIIYQCPYIACEETFFQITPLGGAFPPIISDSDTPVSGTALSSADTKIGEVHLALPPSLQGWYLLTIIAVLHPSEI